MCHDVEPWPGIGNAVITTSFLASREARSDGPRTAPALGHGQFVCAFHTAHLRWPIRTSSLALMPLDRKAAQWLHPKIER